MKALENVIARVDSALNSFWIGFVLRQYHKLQVIRFRRLAERLAQTTVKHPRLEYVSHQALRHQLEAELLLGRN